MDYPGLLEFGVAAKAAEALLAAAKAADALLAAATAGLAADVLEECATLGEEQVLAAGAAFEAELPAHSVRRAGAAAAAAAPQQPVCARRRSSLYARSAPLPVHHCSGADNDALADARIEQRAPICARRAERKPCYGLPRYARR